MSSPNSTTEVTAILEALRAEVRAQREMMNAGTEDPAFNSIERELRYAAEELEITRVVSAHWPLEGRTLHERAWNLVHRVVRRGLRWYINPIVDQQNAFNASATHAIRLLIEAYADLHTRIANLERRCAQTDDAPKAASGAVPSEPSEAQGSEPDKGSLIARLEAQRAVSAHWNLHGRGLLGHVRTLVQRGIRQYLRWLINPIVEQQNMYNAALTRSMQPLLNAEAMLRKRLTALERSTSGANAR